VISVEESPDVACFLDIFRSTVGAIGWARESLRLENSLPQWVKDSVLDVRIIMI
jgi:hypothetical protein